MGLWPLYCAVRGGVLFFASEVAALFRAPSIHEEMDPIGLDQCFNFWFSLAPRHQQAPPMLAEAVTEVG